MFMSAAGELQELRMRSLSDPEILRELVKNLKEGIYITSPEGAFVDANQALLDILGVPSVEELRKHQVTDFIEAEIRAWQKRIFERDGYIREFELKIRRADGSTRTVLDSAFPLEDQETGETFYHGVLVDITIHKELENQLREQSIRDPLTGCFNRRYLSMFEVASESLPGSWGCILIDVDHFKQYNDRHGHQAGDQVLVTLARFLMRQVRAEEAVIRLGGDEFLILLGHADEQHTQTAAQRIESAAREEGQAPFSLGWAARRKKEKLEKTLSRADKNLYSIRTEQRTPERERRKKRASTE
jgi:diguanylate cyclase (GGDEF)-like protein/PAS domain S-box-containing protein